jgi:hypothetical protein
MSLPNAWSNAAEGMLALRLSVIIVSYNTRPMTLECLSTLYADLAGIDSEVWVVDNASGDGSAAAIQSAFPQVRLIANNRNVGFGRANNQAMKESCGEFILLLNSDAFPQAGSTRRLIDYLEQNANIAAVGPVLLNADQSFQESVLSFPTLGHVLRNRLWINAVRRVFGAAAQTAQADLILDPGRYLCGACMLVRRACYESVGGFDDDFFFYGEDADWQKRMLEAGWSLARINGARAIHRHGSSGGGDRLRFTLCYFDSEERFVRKHDGNVAALCVRLVTIVNASVHLARHLYRIPVKWFRRRTEDFPARFAWRLLLQQFGAGTREYSGAGSASMVDRSVEAAKSQSS